jgi:hypothetical protein
VTSEDFDAGGDVLVPWAAEELVPSGAGGEAVEGHADDVLATGDT